MPENNDKNKDDDDFDSILKAEGIIIESGESQNDDSLNDLNTEDIEREIFNAVGAKIEKTTETNDNIVTGDVKKELSIGGIEILPNEPSSDKDNL